MTKTQISLLQRDPAIAITFLVLFCSVGGIITSILYWSGYPLWQIIAFPPFMAFFGGTMITVKAFEVESDTQETEPQETTGLEAYP